MHCAWIVVLCTITYFAVGGLFVLLAYIRDVREYAEEHGGLEYKDKRGVRYCFTFDSENTEILEVPVIAWFFVWPFIGLFWIGIYPFDKVLCLIKRIVVRHGTAKFLVKKYDMPLKEAKELAKAKDVRESFEALLPKNTYP